jgi:hypothetical protein
MREVVSLEEYNLVVFYNQSTSEIWPDKKSGLGWISFIREVLLVLDT